MENKEEGIINLHETKDLPDPYKELRIFIICMDIALFGLLFIFLFLLGFMLVFGIAFFNLFPVYFFLFINFVGIFILRVDLVKQRKNAPIVYGVMITMGFLLFFGESIIGGTFPLNIYAVVLLALPLLILLQIFDFRRKGVLK